MRLAICAATAALGFALAGCNSSSPERQFVAKAVEEPPPPKAKLSQREKLEDSISRCARTYDIPESLIHTAVRRESNYNPAAKNGPYWGLMQIRYDTARSVGYSGPAKGLLDAETNLAYAGAYLANAFRVAGGDAQRAIQLYAKGFYFEAKRKGLLGQMASGRSSTDELSEPAAPAVAKAEAQPVVLAAIDIPAGKHLRTAEPEAQPAPIMTSAEAQAPIALEEQTAQQ
ncbi:transglycosylase-like protein with SLT domain [Methylosinus sp. sav-2]|uniref:lytic transglycosylase domain-containing protein n=1 Tax=Methylosinus sp. sav-2 TaxID=2485168 RepID=UPI00047C62E9|nr:lytic transglycosylase domain-containing protein [Methylosinus sp. sav-2]TDX64305.1 transglycosylase-like protein with SLT domain [Methylosinus sp. sav-2]